MLSVHVDVLVTSFLFQRLSRVRENKARELCLTCADWDKIIREMNQYKILLRFLCQSPLSVQLPALAVMSGSS
ncbi:uncharacterized [Tachysurus ichikawai]